MRKHTLFLLLIVLSLKVGGHAATPSSLILSQTAAEYDAWLKQEDLGIQQQYGLPITQLPQISLIKAKQDAARAQLMLGRLASIKTTELTHDEWLNREALVWYLKSVVDGQRFYWLNSSATPYNGPIAGVNEVLGLMRFENKGDADRYLDLMTQYVRLVRQIRAKLVGQAERKIVLPKEELTLTVPFWKSLGQTAAKSPLAVSGERLRGLPSDDVTTFQAALTSKIEKEVNPAIMELVAYLDGPYAKRAPDGVGLSQYPGGREYYDALVRYHTTLDTPAEKIHQFGMDEVKRISGEMAAIRKSLGFSGTEQEFSASLKKNPRTTVKTAEEMGERLNGYLRRIEPVMLQSFKRMPKAPYAVKRLQPELEGAQTFGYYQQPTKDDPTGYYRFNGSNAQDKSLAGAGDLIYHEILPGHHFQGSLVLESNLPAFRKQFGPNGYGEGWGEYSSELAGDMGMYSDPYDHYGKLLGEMMLALRLVVDTGMNAMGWPREKAAALMREHTTLSDREIFTETLRYSVDIPGQALAYHLGKTEFMRLREQAKRELGKKFDVREFHEAVLSPGAIPMTVLAKHIEWWIKEKKTESKD